MKQEREHAETLAAGALAWLASQDDLLQVYLGSSGMDPATLRARAGDPEALPGGEALDWL